MKTVMMIVGTRPEAIKMAPVHRELRRVRDLRVVLVSTGQHGAILKDAFDAFDLKPDHDLGLLREGQGMSELVGRMLIALDGLLAEVQPDLVLVHGDTATSFGAALAAFYRGIRVAHVEAGLRTWSLGSPFPEEFHRQTISRIAGLHFAPTDGALANLVQDGVERESVVVTGNTAIDALESVELADNEPADPLVLITLHRRESGMGRLVPVLEELRQRALDHPELTFVYPLHPSPHVGAAARTVMAGVPNVRLTRPLPYREFVAAMRRAVLIVTDSGGIQEEAAHLNVPVLLVREHTERPEAVQSGHVTLVGLSPAALREAFETRLHETVPRAPSPFGAGHAAATIARCVA